MKKQLYFRFIFIIAILPLITRCTSVKVTTLKTYPSKPVNCKLDVYINENEIKKDYEIVCELNSKTGTTLFSKKTVANAIDRAKPKACEYGSDAIIVISSEKIGFNFWNWGQGKAMIKGIKYK